MHFWLSILGAVPPFTRRPVEPDPHRVATGRVHKPFLGPLKPTLHRFTGWLTATRPDRKTRSIGGFRAIPPAFEEGGHDQGETDNDEPDPGRRRGPTDAHAGKTAQDEQTANDAREHLPGARPAEQVIRP